MKSSSLWLALSVAVAAAACSSKSTTEEDPNSTDPAATPASSGTTDEKATTSDSDSESSATDSEAAAKDSEAGLAEVKDVADLKLAGAFKISLPKALTGAEESGSSLMLADALKSQEACQMGQTLKDAVRRASEAGNFFCHLEAEKEKLVFDQKIRIMTDGKEFARLHVDRSVPGTITIGFCSHHGESEENRQIIHITKLTDIGPMGVVLNHGTEKRDDGDQSWSSSVDFDATVEGVLSLVSKDLNNSGDDSFRRLIELTMKSTGEVSASMSSKGSWQGSSFEERGLAAMDSEVGNVVFDSKGVHEGNDYEFSRRAYFDKDGNIIAAADSEAFGSDGALHLMRDKMPEYLPTAFEPDPLDGWVADACPDYDVTVELDPESPAHQACEGDNDHSQPDCWNQDKYQSGHEDAE